jgi:hypothetical protein
MGSLRQTPAWYQSRSLRQHAILLPHPISAGKYSQGMPVFSTNRTPVSAARSDTRGRPPLGFGGSGGRSRAIRAQNASGNSSFATLLHGSYSASLAAYATVLLRVLKSNCPSSPGSGRDGPLVPSEIEWTALHRAQAPDL